MVGRAWCFHRRSPTPGMDVRDVVPRDAILSIDDPAFAGSYDGDPEDEVIVFDVEGAPARAYPLGILHYHEVVNDVVAGRPIAVTWCPLCASAIVYDRTVDGRTPDFGTSGNDTSGGSEDGLVLSFGVSGKLADDDLVLYDRETGSEWKQSLGECIAGELKGRSLTVLPASVTTVERFRRRHRNGELLVPPGGRSEASGDGPETAPIEYDAAPYERYFAGEGFGLAAHRGDGSREWERDDLAPKEIVLGIERDGTVLGVPRSRVVGPGDRERGRDSDGRRRTDRRVRHAARDERVREPRVRVRADRRSTRVRRRRDAVGGGDRRECRRADARAGADASAVRVRVAGRSRPGRVLRGVIRGHPS